MCDRTIKMKLKKGSVLQDVNSNTNTIELNVKPNDNFNSKAFGRHADTGPISDICDRIEEDIKNITKQNDK